VVVRCMLLPAVLELLGPVTWRFPRWLDARLPRINVEGSVAEGAAHPETPAVEPPSTFAPSL
jgi:putative drug exporter of the RND superfamily